MKLRTKFLLSLCGVLLASGGATVLVVRHTCKVKIKQVLVHDLRGSILTFQTYEKSREESLRDGAGLLANLPSLRALMTTQDGLTIQDGATDIWRCVHSDLFVLSDRQGRITAVLANSADVTAESVKISFGTRLLEPQNSNFILVSSHLYEVFTRPIYFGDASEAHLLGLVTLGYEIDQQLAQEMKNIAASDVVFEFGGTIVASTLKSQELKQLPFIVRGFQDSATGPLDVAIGREHFLSTSLVLASSPTTVTLTVLKSLDQASFFLKSVNRILFGLSVAALGIGCALVLLITRRFTRPLEDLLQGVRALEHGDFNYPLEDSKDEFAELTHAFTHMRKALSATQEKLLEAERLATIGRMASSISHDLRHRLSSVLANAEFLADDTVRPGQRQELYEGVTRAVCRMTGTLESLQEFSRRPDALRVEFVSLQEIVEDALESIRLHPEFQAVEIRVSSGETLSGWFDPQCLERAFYNLLLNACQVVPTGRGTIAIAIRRIADHSEILISDNGPGIPWSIRESLFQPFVSYGKQNGSGLGLAIVQKAFQDHGGDVSLQSGAPGATTFKLVLPIEAPSHFLCSAQMHSSENSVGVTHA